MGRYSNKKNTNLSRSRKTKTLLTVICCSIKLSLTAVIWKIENRKNGKYELWLVRKFINKYVNHIMDEKDGVEFNKSNRINNIILF